MPSIPYQWPGSWQRGPLRKPSTIILAFELYTRVICCTMGSAEFPHAALTSSCWAVLTPLAGAGLDCSAHPVPLSYSMLLTKSIPALEDKKFSLKNQNYKFRIVFLLVKGRYSEQRLRKL